MVNVWDIQSAIAVKGIQDFRQKNLLQHLQRLQLRLQQQLRQQHQQQREKLTLVKLIMETARRFAQVRLTDRQPFVLAVREKSGIFIDRDNFTKPIGFKAPTLKSLYFWYKFLDKSWKRSTLRWILPSNQLSCSWNHCWTDSIHHYWVHRRNGRSRFGGHRRSKNSYKQCS